MEKPLKKMSKRFLIIVLFCVIAGLAFAAVPDTVVYITKTREKYHTEGCSSLRNSKIAIALEEAASKGYEPCKLCNPPVLDAGE
jgi:methylphosphotriester-DNA--protein-cysteine methyltransferase